MLLVVMLAGPLSASMPAPRQAEAASAPVTFRQVNDTTIQETTGPSRAAPYGIALAIPTTAGVIVDATVTVRELNHTAATDLDVLVTSPSNRAVLLMSDVGGTSNFTDTTITFDDAETSSLPSTSTTIASGRYRPTNHGTGDVMPPPAPAPGAKGYGSQLSFFDGSNPTGVWKLWIVDDFTFAYAGNLDRGWTLTLLVSFGGRTRTIQQTVNTSAKLLNATIADPYPSTIAVNDLEGVVHAARVTLHDVQHTAPSNLDILLVGPGGQKVELMSDAGGGNDIDGVELTFRDDTSGSLPPNSTIVSGEYRPTNLEGSTNDAFPAPAPLEPSLSTLSAFNGTNPNGSWQLFVADDSAFRDGGTVDEWSLTLEVNSPPVIGEMPDIMVDAGRTRDITIPVTDLDGDQLSFDASTIPSYASMFTETILGVRASKLRLAPGGDDTGTSYNAIIRATDGSLSDTESLTIHVVEDNDAPNFTWTPLHDANDLDWYDSPIEINVHADDGPDGSGIASIRVRLNGAQTYDSGEVLDDDFLFPIFGEGTTTMTIDVFDNVGNLRAITELIQIDTVDPTATQPTQRFRNGTRLGTSTVPVHVQWSGSDATSGLRRFELRELIDRNGDVPALALPDPLATSIVRQLAPGNEYTHCIDVFDRADNFPLFECSEHTNLIRVQEAAASITYSSGWIGNSNSDFSGEAVRFAATAGETATYTFTGSSVAWATTIGTGRGIAEVSLDGGTPVSIDLFAATQTTRQLVFARNGLADQEHTLTVRVTGDKNSASTGRRIDIDAFATLDITQ